MVLFTVLAVSVHAHAVSWKIFGACDNKPVQQGVFQADLNKSVGAVSLTIFAENNIPYVGSEEGLNSILNTPVGLDSIEVVSDSEMRVYGWCYSVNGKQPTEMPHQLQFQSQDDQLVWFYAYSTNKDNQWTDYCSPAYCSPAYWIRAEQFCRK